MTNPIPGLSQGESRVIVVVMDGAGVGALPDAHLYGDQGANTLKHLLGKHKFLKLDNLYSLGLAKILELEDTEGSVPQRQSYYGRMQPRSPGKDTTSGHWELAGLILEKPFPVYPAGFPDPVTGAFKKAIGRNFLGNKTASGTEIIKELGEKHLETGFPIIYTSADSVFQIAAHEKVVSRELLYAWCESARSVLVGEHAVGRVIARPFAGEPGNFMRTAGRRDFSLAPPGVTILDQVKQSGRQVAVIGKVTDIFAHRGVTFKRPGGDNDAVANDLLFLIEKCEAGLIWATFGDFDTIYGHRNDSAGFAAALERFDCALTQITAALQNDDLLFITADHGCDPTFPTTDHTREYVPIMAWSPALAPEPAERNLGVCSTYADLAASAAAWLGLDAPHAGASFIGQRKG